MAEIHLNITLNPFFLSHMRGIVDTVSRSLKRRPAVALRLGEDADEDLREAWMQGLLESLQTDLDALNDLFMELGAGGGLLNVSEEQAEKMLRSASALRLRLRESCFKGLSEDALETGKVDFHQFSPEDQRVYGVYLFLAHLQEQLIAELDQSASDWQE